MMKRWLLLLVPVWTVTFILIACQGDGYDTGDGQYSYLRADFAEVHTSEAKTVVNARTDEGDSLVMQPPLECAWASVADTTYRALLYYNREPGKELSTHAISAVQVLVLRAAVPREGTTVHTDPLTLESTWISPNGKYFNLGLYVKTGQVEEKNVYQTIGMVRDTVITAEDGTREHRLRLTHDQHRIPEYYSSRVYASMPLNIFSKGDAVRVEINTYEGVIVKTFTITQ